MARFTNDEIRITLEALKQRKNYLERERAVWRASSQFDFTRDCDKDIQDLEKVIKKLEGLI